MRTPTVPDTTGLQDKGEVAGCFARLAFDSQVWLDRRTCYTRSLATMSMVGYILGLGDRHPSNITLDKMTNKVIHIDFGDCFEVAQQREKFPERVPFRLTRMLVNSMEASGIDGTFHTTCERVMKVRSGLCGDWVLGPGTRSGATGSVGNRPVGRADLPLRAVDGKSHTLGMQGPRNPRPESRIGAYNATPVHPYGMGGCSAGGVGVRARV